jgi:hypothetical protein
MVNEPREATWGEILRAARLLLALRLSGHHCPPWLARAVAGRRNRITVTFRG